MNILASRNQDSGVEEPTFQTQKPPLIGLVTFNKKFQQWQAKSRFAGCWPALHYWNFLYSVYLPIGFLITKQKRHPSQIIQNNKKIKTAISDHEETAIYFCFDFIFIYIYNTKHSNLLKSIIVHIFSTLILKY